MVKITNVRFRAPGIYLRSTRAYWKITIFSNWHAPCIVIGIGPMVDRQELLKGLPMFTSFTTARETATVFAGALITALLFVSAATSLPIA
jgi:hypothetical protein